MRWTARITEEGLTVAERDPVVRALAFVMQHADRVLPEEAALWLSWRLVTLQDAQFKTVAVLASRSKLLRLL